MNRIPCFLGKAQFYEDNDNGNIERGSITQICCHFKTQKCLSVSRYKEIIVKFVINYHPSAIKPFVD